MHQSMARGRNAIKLNLSIGAACVVQFRCLFLRVLKIDKFISINQKDKTRNLLTIRVNAKHISYTERRCIVFRHLALDAN